MEEIAEGIFYENSYFGVTLGAIFTTQGTLLVDAPLRAEDSKSWRTALSLKSANANRLLVNLDAHPDRTLGARSMETTIVAHQKTALVFRSRPSVFKGHSIESGSEWESYDDAVGTRWAIPDITFTQDLHLHWGLRTIILEHHPGPTAGAIWVIVPSDKILFVGDALLMDQPPFLANADIPVWQETLDTLQASYKNYTIISGRGGLVFHDAIKLQKKLLGKIIRELERLAEKQSPLEATTKLIPGILAGLNYPPQMEEQYAQRLRHGLIQYYTAYYQTSNIEDQHIK